MAAARHNSVAQWIERERKRLGWSRERLARTVDLSAKTVERHEAGPDAGGTEPNATMLMAYEAAFGVQAPRPSHHGIDITVPRGTSIESLTAASASRRAQLQAFIYDMVRLGATDEDAAYIQARALAYLEAADRSDVLLDDADLDAEFEAYLRSVLLPRVVARIEAAPGAKRGVKVADPKPRAGRGNRGAG